MKWIILVFALWTPVALAYELLSKDAFTDKYIDAALKMSKGIRAAKSGELEVTFNTANGEERVSYLDNAYAAYKNTPESLEQIIQHYGRSFVEEVVPTKSLFEKATHIFPVIKGKDYINQVIRMMKERGEEQLPFYYETLNSELFVLYVIDTPNSMTFISQEALNEIGLHKEELRETAKSNLKASMQLQLKGDASALSMLVADGIYEASFILLDNVWNKEVFPVKGDIVIHLPSRDVVLITGSEDEQGLQEVQNIIHNPDSEWPYMISTKGFKRTRDGWTIFGG